jgi:uncharacterized membrane protein
MSFLRFLMLLSLVVWLGGLIFFSFVVAPTVFSVLPTKHMAGSVVARSLSMLHWMGIVSGIVFLVSSMLYSRLNRGVTEPFAARHLLVYGMVALTVISQFGISPKMVALRSQMGEIDQLALDNPLRMQFDSLHVWSVRLEGGVFLLGLAVAYLVARQFGNG